tara:strand:- start:2358 stop:2531 length:174 start_codon:yes stop_codon:yes gene_type:complete
MPKFEIVYLAGTYEFFYVTADTKAEAEELVWKGNLTPDITETDSWEYCWAIEQEEEE